MENNNTLVDTTQRQPFRYFNNDTFGQVRTIMVNNQPYFVANDITTILGYTNCSKTVADHVNEADSARQRVFDGTQVRNMLLINESGIYSLLLTSKIKGAEEFRHWITADVLPSIRRTGQYNNRNKMNTVSKQFSNYHRYNNAEELKIILNAFAEAMSKIRINVDVNVRYPDMPQLDVPKEENADNERLNNLELKLDDLINSLGGMDNKPSITPKESSIQQQTNVFDNEEVDYYLPDDIAYKIGLFSVTNRPHSRVICAIARSLGMPIDREGYYCDEYIRLVPVNIFMSNNRATTTRYQVYFSQKAVEAIVAELNKIIDKTYTVTLYKRDTNTHLIGDVRKRYIVIGKTKFFLGEKSNSTIKKAAS